MTTLFGPRKRNRRIRNLVYIAVLIILGFLAYGFITNDDSLDTAVPVVTQETGEVTSTRADVEIPEATETPMDSDSIILQREYPWLVPTKEVMELQELLGITADGLYGPGTREVHIATLEANGLPLSGVPNIPTGCDILIGADICSVQKGNLMDIALPALTSGLGSISEDDGWYTECARQFRTVYWGALFVDFTKTAYTNPKVERWGIRNTFHVVNGWEKMFPGIVRLPESSFVEWDPNDASKTPVITELLVPGGPLIVPESSVFEASIGYPLLYDYLSNKYVFHTSEYEVEYFEYSGNPAGSAASEFHWEFSETVRECEPTEN